MKDYKRQKSTCRLKEQIRYSLELLVELHSGYVDMGYAWTIAKLPGLIFRRFIHSRPQNRAIYGADIGGPLSITLQKYPGFQAGDESKGLFWGRND